MRTLVTSMIVFAAVFPPAASWSQQKDAAYCAALAQKYQDYSSASQHRSESKNAGIDEAVSQCATKPATAIPVLERALKDAKVPLPSRS